MSEIPKNWRVKLNPEFLESNKSVRADEFSLFLLNYTWQIPHRESTVWIPMMGRTGHKAMPTSCVIDHVNRKRIPLFAKPMERYLAEREYTNSLIAFQRGINLPPVVAQINLESDSDSDSDSDSILLSRLIHSAEPVSALTMDFTLRDLRIFTPDDFLNFYIGSIADMVSKGVVHGDLHDGNIGHQLYKDTPPKVIFFDFETSTVLDISDLNHLKSGSVLPGPQQNRVNNFINQSYFDLGVFLAYIKYRGFPLSQNEITDKSLQIFKLRSKIHPSLYTDKKALETLQDAYLRATIQQSTVKEITKIKEISNLNQI